MLKLLRRLLTDPAFAKKKAFLKSLPLFKDLSGRDIGAVMQALHIRTYEEGEAVFVEGDIGRALFLVETGRVELTKSDPQGRPQRLVVAGPGDFFGEMALLEELPRSASATAIEKATLHLFYRTTLEALLRHDPRVGVSILLHIARLLSARLRRASQSLVADGAAPPASPRAA